MISGNASLFIHLIINHLLHPLNRKANKISVRYSPTLKELVGQKEMPTDTAMLTDLLLTGR